MNDSEASIAIHEWLKDHEEFRERVLRWLEVKPPEYDEPLSEEEIERAGGRAIPLSRTQWMARHLWKDAKLKIVLASIFSSEELTDLAERGHDFEVASKIQLPPDQPKSLFVTKLGLAALIGEDETAAITLALKAVRDNEAYPPTVREKAATRLEMLAVGGPGIDLSSVMAQNAIAELVIGGVVSPVTVSLIQQTIFPVESPSPDLVGTALLPFRTDGRVGDLP